MSYTVRILTNAWSDADRIFDWLVARSSTGATRWYSAFLDAASDLAVTPLRHGVAPESDELGYVVRNRFFKTRRGRMYRILFIVVDDEVRILRIRGPGQAPVLDRDLER